MSANLRRSSRIFANGRQVPARSFLMPWPSLRSGARFARSGMRFLRVNGALRARFKSGRSEMLFTKGDNRSRCTNSCTIQIIEYISDRCKVRVNVHNLPSGWMISILDGSRNWWWDWMCEPVLFNFPSGSGMALTGIWRYYQMTQTFTNFDLEISCDSENFSHI
jgi:hypothetical protein